MAEISITKLSSNGKLTVPLELRKGIKEGEEFIIIRDEDRIILKKTESIKNQLKEDIEKVLERIESGEYISEEKFFKK